MILRKYRVHFYVGTDPAMNSSIVLAPSPEIAIALASRRGRRMIEANPYNVAGMLPDKVDIAPPVWWVWTLIAVRRTQAFPGWLWNRFWLRRVKIPD